MRILTFDIEEWFHILDHKSTRTEAEWSSYESRLDRNMERIFECLDGHRQKATFFCLGWVARQYPQVVRQIVDSGHELATHSDQHQLAYEQSPTLFREDLRASILALEDTSGHQIRAYRAPGFSLTRDNPWVFDELIEAGIEIDCSIFPAPRTHGGFPGFGHETPTRIVVGGGVLKEFPINTVGMLRNRLIFSGGGYFRLLPYPLIRHLCSTSDYVMTYFHPRDFDPDQPIIEGLSRLRRFKSYYGLDGAMMKLEKMLNEFDFMSLEDAEARVNWDLCPTVDLRG